MTLDFGAKKWFAFIISILLLSNSAIILNIPFLRQILGFLFLIFLPGLLMLQILKLNRIGTTEKLVLSVGLSLFFSMLFGLVINSLSLSLGYETPLSTVSLLISFNIVFGILAIVGYKSNKNSIFSLPSIDLTTTEKAFLVPPVLFPALSIFGTYLMKTADNNIILMFLLFSIPTYVALVCFFNHKFSKRLYPVVIFLISISLLLIFMLRFPHICGHDVHEEYGIYFLTTFNNLHWSIFGHSALDACLSISLLPTIFQSLLNVNAQEYFFKLIYVFMYSFSPLAIYILANKYIDEIYAFLASFFFMSQATFLSIAGNPRTSVAIFFVVLTCLVFFNDEIHPVKKRILLILFLFSVLVSHYSTTYIFFFIMIGTFLGVTILSNKYTFKKVMSLTLIIIFSSLIFFWYAQVTETGFSAGVRFFENTFSDLNQFFIDESRDEGITHLVGKELTYPILSRANLIVTWCTFSLIGIGVLTMLKRYKEMIDISNINIKKPDFLKTKFEMEFLVMALVCAGLLLIMVVLPYVSKGYGIQRLYALVLTILSVFFVLGGMTLSRLVKNFSFNRKKEKQGENDLQVRACLIILLVLIPYFMFVSGVMYQICGVRESYILNSEGMLYDRGYIHDSESCAAKWLKRNSEKSSQIYITDGYAKHGLVSQGGISLNQINAYAFSQKKLEEGYMYLCYNNVVKGKFAGGRIPYSITNYLDQLTGKSKLYDNNCAKIYK